MAINDFKVRHGIVVGPDDFSVDVSTDTATFADGYVVNIGTDRVLKQTDNISELTNDSGYLVSKADVDALGVDAGTLDGAIATDFAGVVVSDGLGYTSTTLASSLDISESVRPAITAYPHIRGFRTGTSAALTFAQSVEEAAARGARLLTIQELEAGVIGGSGFSYDLETTWTSSPAGVGLVYGNTGAGTGTRVVLSTNTDTAAGGYAVSVVGQRQWADTQYATVVQGIKADNATTKLANIEDNATRDQTKFDIDALNIDADTLDGVNSSQFLRSDTSDTMNGPLTISHTNLQLSLVDNTYSNNFWMFDHQSGDLFFRYNNLNSAFTIFEEGNSAFNGDLDHFDNASIYSNSSKTEGVRVEYNASSKSLDYNFF